MIKVNEKVFEEEPVIVENDFKHQVSIGDGGRQKFNNSFKRDFEHQGVKYQEYYDEEETYDHSHTQAQVTEFQR